MENLNQYKSSAQLKALAKEHLFGKYGTVIGASVTVSILTGFITLSCTGFINVATWTGVIVHFLISFVLSVLTGVFHSGINYMYLKVSCGRPVTVSDIFYGFKLYPEKALQIQLYLSLWMYLSMLPMTLLSHLLLLAPYNAMYMLYYSLAAILFGVVTTMVSLIYSQTFFLLHDFPDRSVKELLATSKSLMKGSKGRLFYLIVSFLPLMLLGMLSCGIAYLWLAPYMNTTSAEFFLDLIKTKQPLSQTKAPES